MRSITTSGHSLGAALAALCAFDLGELLLEAQVPHDSSGLSFAALTAVPICLYAVAQLELTEGLSFMQGSPLEFTFGDRARKLKRGVEAGAQAARSRVCCTICAQSSVPNPAWWMCTVRMALASLRITPCGNCRSKLVFQVSQTGARQRKCSLMLLTWKLDTNLFAL